MEYKNYSKVKPNADTHPRRISKEVEEQEADTSSFKCLFHFGFDFLFILKYFKVIKTKKYKRLSFIVM